MAPRSGCLLAAAAAAPPVRGAPFASGAPRPQHNTGGTFVSAALYTTGRMLAAGALLPGGAFLSLHPTGGCSLPPLPPRQSGEPHFLLELPVLITSPEGGSPQGGCAVSVAVDASSPPSSPPSNGASPGGCLSPPLPPRRSGELHLPPSLPSPPLHVLELPVPTALSEGCAPPLLLCRFGELWFLRGALFAGRRRRAAAVSSHRRVPRQG